MNYLLEKAKIFRNLKFLTSTVNDRLISSFDNLEDEAEKKATQIIEEGGPDNEDGSLEYEAAYVREAHLRINNALKQELKNIVSVWLFHLFEKNCHQIFQKTKNIIRFIFNCCI